MAIRSGIISPRRIRSSSPMWQRSSRKRPLWPSWPGKGDLSRDFNVVNFNESVSQKEDNFVLELAPKEPNAALSKLTLTVDKKTYYVVQADVFDGLGNVTRTRFMDIKTNVGLPNSFFNFTIPPGTEVLKMQEPSSAPTGKGTPSK